MMDAGSPSSSSWSIGVGGTTLFVVTYHLHNWLSLSWKPQLYLFDNTGTNNNVKNDANNNNASNANSAESKQRSKIRSLLEACPTLHHTYYPPLFFFNCHLQLVPFTLLSKWHKVFPPARWVREHAILPDGEVVHLDWAGQVPHADPHDHAPVLVLHHGSCGDSNDLPGQAYILPAIRRGWKVCVLNRRGHGRALANPVFNFFGSTEDARSIISVNIKGKLPNAPIFMLGLSAGSGLVARYMGEQGMNEIDSAHATFCTAAVGISPGYNIENCMGRMISLYQNYVLQSAKEYHLVANKGVLQACETFQQCLSSSNLQDWLDHCYSMAGFSSQGEYYKAVNPMEVSKYIRDPSLFINAMDDPLCVIENVHENVGLLQKHAPGAAVVVTKTGSHCSFLEVGMTSWVERAAFEFFDAALASSRLNM